MNKKTGLQLENLSYVKITHPDKRIKDVYYGVVHSYNQETRKYFEEGNLLVTIQLTGKQMLFPVTEKAMLTQYGNNDLVPFIVTSIPMNLDPENPDEFQKHVDEEFQKAKVKSDSLKGLKAGKLFSVGVADGQAWYVVTNVNKKTVIIEWRGFCLDNYYAPFVGEGGVFPKHTVEKYVEWDEKMAELLMETK